MCGPSYPDDDRRRLVRTLLRAVHWDRHPGRLLGRHRRLRRHGLLLCPRLVLEPNGHTSHGVPHVSDRALQERPKVAARGLDGPGDLRAVGRRGPVAPRRRGRLRQVRRLLLHRLPQRHARRPLAPRRGAVPRGGAVLLRGRRPGPGRADADPRRPRGAVGRVPPRVGAGVPVDHPWPVQLRLPPEAEPDQRRAGAPHEPRQSPAVRRFLVQRVCRGQGSAAFKGVRSGADRGVHCVDNGICCTSPSRRGTLFCGSSRPRSGALAL
mmetsp:Transcript_61622/g.101841  ORF Transcript_61622/g.101841 Transcript_61622/m.101841 type:complete len:266 (+) Transcript_61622:216-1013(+)